MSNRTMVDVPPCRPGSLQNLRMLAPIAPPVQGLERSLLHRAPRGHLPARSLYDGVLHAGHEHRCAPSVGVTCEREIPGLARQAVLDEADAMPVSSHACSALSPNGIAAAGTSRPRKPRASYTS